MRGRICVFWRRISEWDSRRQGAQEGQELFHVIPTFFQFGGGIRILWMIAGSLVEGVNLPLDNWDGESRTGMAADIDSTAAGFV